MQFIIISGLSGAGKSRAASDLEDLGFYCVDNMPAEMIPQFASLCLATKGRYEKVALVTDVRSSMTFDSLFQSLDKLDEMHLEYAIFFIEASTEVIIKRYKETRRSHPLAEECDSLEQAIELERKMLAPLRERADYVIDTSNLSTAKLKGELRRLFAKSGSAQGRMDVRVSSFGFKYGIPMEADLVFDVRFLPNPYYVAELRPMTGLDAPVRDYVFQSPVTDEFLSRLGDFVGWLLPRYEEEGKTALVVAVGCTGGHHRSVAVAHALADLVRRAGFPVSESHRDLGRN